MVVVAVLVLVALVGRLVLVCGRRRQVVTLLAALTAMLLGLGWGTGANVAIVPTVGLGTAANFSILAGTTVTNTGPTTVQHDLGVSPGTAVSGFPPGTVTPPATMEVGNAVALKAQNDLTTAYNDAAGRSVNAVTGADLTARG